MVGKPNLPQAGDDRPDLRGAAMATPGLAALDQEREASMADEGGASGAAVEAQDGEGLRHLAESAMPGARRHLPYFAIGVVAGITAGVGYWAYYRRQGV